MILFKHVLRIYQIMFKNSIILAKKKILSNVQNNKIFLTFSCSLKCFLLYILCFRSRKLSLTKRRYLHLYNMILKKIREKRNEFFINRTDESDKFIIRRRLLYRKIL